MDAMSKAEIDRAAYLLEHGSESDGPEIARLLGLTEISATGHEPTTPPPKGWLRNLIDRVRWR